MIDLPVEELLFSALAWTGIAAWRAVPLLCIVLVFDLLLRRRIAARFHCLLWMIVAVRMLSPFSVESSFSLHGSLMTELEAVGFATQARPASPYDARNLEIDFDRDSFRNAASDEAIVSQGTTPEDLARDSRMVGAEVYSSPAEYQATMANEPVSIDLEIVVFCLIAGIWLLGTSFLLLRGFVQSIGFSRLLRRSMSITDQAVVDEVLRACDVVGVGRRPMLKEVEGLTVPAVFGVRRPTVCLPPGMINELSSSDLRLVLMHELAHVKRRDGLVLTLCLFVRALHWFNPMAWLIVARVRHYMEQAADEIAMSASRGSGSTDYGRLLLRFASNERQPQHLAAIGLLFSSTGRKLARRIDMLDGTQGRNHWLAQVVASTVVFTLAMTGLTDAKPVGPPPAPASFVPDVHDTWEQLHPVVPGLTTEQRAVEKRVYDVATVLEKLRETQPERESRAFLQEIVAPGACVLSGDRLAVTVSADRHDSVSQRLRQMARSGHWEIQFEVRFIQVALDQLAALDVDWISDAVQPAADGRLHHQLHPDSESVLADIQAPDDGELIIQMRRTDTPTQPVLGVRVTDQQAGNFVRRTAVDTRSSMMLAPKVRVFNGMSACISDEVLRPFVTGMRPDGLEHDRSMKPVIDCFPEGFRFHVRGDVTDAEQIQIRCAVTMSSLEEVALANLPIRAGSDSDARLTVQVPQTNSVTVRAGGTLKRTESLLITCPTTFTKDQPRQESHALCYLVTPRWSRDLDGPNHGR